jgi:hypothetical protein
MLHWLQRKRLQAYGRLKSYKLLPAVRTSSCLNSHNADCCFKCRLLFWMPIVTLNADCYFEYQSSNDPPIGTSNTNWYFKYQNWYFEYQLLLQIPTVTSNTNCYFKYQLLLRMPWVTIHQQEEQEEQQQQSGYKSRASTTCSRLNTFPNFETPSKIVHRNFFLAVWKVNFDF